MSARGSTIIWGKDDMTRARAPNALHDRRDFNSACRANGHALAPRLHGPGARLTMHNSTIRVPLNGGRSSPSRISHALTSMQSGIHTSPGLFATVTAGAHGEESPRNSFTQFLIETMAVFVAVTLILATGVGLGCAFFALMFMSF